MSLAISLTGAPGFFFTAARNCCWRSPRGARRVVERRVGLRRRLVEGLRPPRLMSASLSRRASFSSSRRRVSMALRAWSTTSAIQCPFVRCGDSMPRCADGQDSSGSLHVIPRDMYVIISAPEHIRGDDLFTRSSNNNRGTTGVLSLRMWRKDGSVSGSRVRAARTFSYPSSPAPDARNLSSAAPRHP